MSAPPTSSPPRNVARQPNSPARGSMTPAKMPLMPAIRPWNSSKIAADRPINRPPIAEAKEVKFSINLLPVAMVKKSEKNKQPGQGQIDAERPALLVAKNQRAGQQHEERKSGAKPAWVNAPAGGGADKRADNRGGHETGCQGEINGFVAQITRKTRKGVQRNNRQRSPDGPAHAQPAEHHQRRDDDKAAARPDESGQCAHAEPHQRKLQDRHIHRVRLAIGAGLRLGGRRAPAQH